MEGARGARLALAAAVTNPHGNRNDDEETLRCP
jgi:hypothetical protein